MTTLSPFHWSDAFLLGYGPMDDTHHEFVDMVSAMQCASDAEFRACLDAFIAHIEAHFREEHEWMERTAFPPRQCHMDEHQAVLKSVYELRDHLAAGGDLEAGRRLTAALIDWFPGHADYMDAALAQWMVKQRFGGKPVVLRKHLELDAS